MFKKELRLVVTEDCNYDCEFCHKEGMKKYENSKLDSADYAYLFKICKENYNWDEVTITGGEPFVRKDIQEIVKALYDENAKITVVTNGELLNKNVDILKYIHRINLSIHSLIPEQYDKIVRRKNKLNEVLKNISAIKNTYPNLNLRLNSVIIKNQNDSIESLTEIVNFAKRINASIKFVELYSDKKEDIVDINEIASKLSQIGFKYKDISNISKQELTDGETIVVLSRIFCSNALLQINPEKYCNRYNDIFITPKGEINICRNSKEDISIYKEIKERNGEELIIKMDNSLNNMGKNCILSKENKKLAINGGIPIFKNKEDAKFIHPKITKNIEEAVIKQLHESISIYDNGGIFHEFETNFKNYIGTEYATTFSSGTAALWAMYEGIGLKKGDEIICPSYTFFATVTPILFTGATPILIDCEEDGNINVREIKSKITKKTKAIVVTHMWGYPCQMEELQKIANENGIYLLEDCSHAHGGKYKGKPLGSFGDAAVFSLQGQKIITGGEGGILVTNNKKINERAILLGHYNKRCKVEIDKGSEFYKFAITGKGMKLRAYPIAIRIANEYFKDINKIHERKKEYAEMITEKVNDIKGLEVLKEKSECDNSWYALILKYNRDEMMGVSRERFVEAIHAEGAVEVDIPGSTCPINDLELFENPNELFKESNFSYRKGEFKNAEKFFNCIIKLPVWYNEEDKDIVIKYIRAIKKVAKNINELV